MNLIKSTSKTSLGIFYIFYIFLYIYKIVYTLISILIFL